MKGFRIGAGLVLFVCAVLLVSQAPAYGPMFIVPLAAGIAGLGGYCLHPYVAAWFARGFVGVVLPDARGEVREQFTRARALIAQAEYEDAERELRSMVAVHPGLADGYILLAGVLYEDLERGDDALAVALEGLKTQSWQDESERLATLAVDICLDRGDKDRARDILKMCASKAGRTGAAARLTERLTHLQP